MRYFFLAAFLAACAADDGGGTHLVDAKAGAPSDQGMNGEPDMAPTDMAGADMAPTDMAGADMVAADAAPNVAIGLGIGERAPTFELQDHDGELVALADLRGQPVLVVGASGW